MAWKSCLVKIRKSYFKKGWDSGMFMKQKAKKRVKIFSLFVIVLSMVFMLTNVGTSLVQADQSLDAYSYKKRRAKCQN